MPGLTRHCGVQGETRRSDVSRFASPALKSGFLTFTQLRHGPLEYTPPRRFAARHVTPLLVEQMSLDYIRAVPTIDLTADELAAVAAAIRRAIEDDRFPRAPRLDPLRAALGKLDAAPKPTPHPIKSPTAGDLKSKASPPAQADKSARR